MIAPGLFGVLYGVGRVLPWVAVGCPPLTASTVIRPLERRPTRDAATGGRVNRIAN